MNPIRKLLRHWRQGTLPWLIRAKYLNRFWPAQIGRWDTTCLPRARRFLAGRALELLEKQPGKKLLVAADPGPHCAEILRRLQNQQDRLVRVDLAARPEETLPPATELAGILVLYPDAHRITRAAQALMRRPDLAEILTEFSFVPQAEYEAVRQLGLYPFPSFIAPHLVEDPGLLELYQESLRHFERKCDLSDFLDLCCALRSVIANGVEGDIAEFGSWKGHSGYLIASYLKSLQSDKRLFLFDMFEHFPEETTGVDQFWSKTHEVNFEEVRAQFAGLPNTTLVKGDFTKTFDGTGITRLALAYVDCDSYRATRYLIGRIFDEVLAPGGAMVFEDYGHPVLLGNRLAVHEGFDGRKGCFKFFSHFSGFYLVVKLK